MIIIWTKGKTVKQIVQAIHTACNRRLRVCIRIDRSRTDIAESTAEYIAPWMEEHAETWFNGWQIDKGNSVEAFGFNGTSYFG